MSSTTVSLFPAFSSCIHVTVFFGCQVLPQGLRKLSFSLFLAKNTINVARTLCLVLNCQHRLLSSVPTSSVPDLALVKEEADCLMEQFVLLLRSFVLPITRKKSVNEALMFCNCRHLLLPQVPQVPQVQQVQHQFL
jgi:hypothetical protein